MGRQDQDAVKHVRELKQRGQLTGGRTTEQENQSNPESRLKSARFKVLLLRCIHGRPTLSEFRHGPFLDAAENKERSAALLTRTRTIGVGSPDRKGSQKEAVSWRFRFLVQKYGWGAESPELTADC